MSITELRAIEDETETAWIAICLLVQLEPLWGEAALVAGEQIAIFLLPDGTLHAVSNRDPATGSFVMSRGIVGSRGVDGSGQRPTIASPLHKQVYDLDTGECYTAPHLQLPVHSIRVVDGEVQVSLSTGPTSDLK